MTDERDRNAGARALIWLGILGVAVAGVWWMAGTGKHDRAVRSAEFSCAFAGRIICDTPTRNAAPYLIVAVGGAVLFLAGIILLRRD